MSDPKFYLRAGDAGELVQGTAGNVLTIQSDGTVRGETPGGGPAVVASFFDPDVPAETELDELVYTVPEGGEGWYRLGGVIQPLAGSFDGSDYITTVNRQIGSGPFVGLDLLVAVYRTFMGGESASPLQSQGAVQNATDFAGCQDIYLLEGDTLTLESTALFAACVVGFRVELVALRSALVA